MHTTCTAPNGKGTRKQLASEYSTAFGRLRDYFPQEFIQAKTEEKVTVNDRLAFISGPQMQLQIHANAASCLLDV